MSKIHPIRKYYKEIIMAKKSKSGFTVVQPDPILIQCIEDAGLENEDTPSMEHFVAKMVDLLKKAEEGYYEYNDNHTCEAMLNKAEIVLRAARTFNKRFGL